MERTFEYVMRSHLKRARISGNELADRISYDRGGLSKVITGERRCPPELAARIDAELDASGAIRDAGALAAIARDADKIRRSLGKTFTTGIMAPADVECWEQAADDYGVSSRTVAAPALLRLVTRSLTALREEVTRYRSASALPRLARVAARLSGLTDHALVCAGDSTRWPDWAQTARHIAIESGDDQVLAWVTFQHAHGHFHSGHPGRALTVVSDPVFGRAGACAGPALAASLRMRIHAFTGNEDAAMTAAADAEHIRGQLDEAERTRSAYGYDDGQWFYHKAHALAMLGWLGQARSELDRALGIVGRDDYGYWSATRSLDAELLIRTGDPGGGLERVAATVRGLSREERIGIPTVQCRQVLAMLPSDLRASKSACELRELLVSPPPA